MNDPHVKPVLDHWQFGWETVEGEGGEIAYVNATDSGNNAGSGVKYWGTNTA